MLAEEVCFLTIGGSKTPLFLLWKTVRSSVEAFIGWSHYIKLKSDIGCVQTAVESDSNQVPS